jgi:hypothetical protein
LTDAAEYTALRRWIRRPDRIVDDPFGNPTVRANMHAGRNWDDVTGESGPEDPDLSLIAFQARDGRPIAVLASFSMHYFSDQRSAPTISGCSASGSRALRRAVRDGQPPLVVAMAHGCSGDIWRRDYKNAEPGRVESLTIQQYAHELADLAFDAYETIAYEDDADLAMAEVRLPLKYRVPDKQRLEWAQRIVEAMGDRMPKDTTEVYAREQIYLHQWQATEVVVQALRIGDMAIATTPTETYALTGLKIKLQSPLTKTMVLDLANGGDGYIPPPEQLRLGGYNTWAARSAGLESTPNRRSPKPRWGCWRKWPIVPGASIARVAGRAARPFGSSAGGLLASGRIRGASSCRFVRPAPRRDLRTRRGVLSGRAPFRLVCTDGETNRAAHFAGGRLDVAGRRSGRCLQRIPLVLERDARRRS